MVSRLTSGLSAQTKSTPLLRRLTSGHVYLTHVRALGPKGTPNMYLTGDGVLLLQ